MRKNVNPTQNELIIDELCSRYSETKNEINKKIDILRNKIMSCDPIKLLSFSADMGLFSMIGKTSEIDLSAEELFTMHATEYIQSILVSSPKQHTNHRNQDSNELHFSIMQQIKEISQLIEEFYFCWCSKLNELQPDLDEETKMLILEFQSMYMVRGKRYQYFEVPYYDSLLGIHDQIFMELFNIKSSDVVNGIKKLQHSLIQEKVDVAKQFIESVHSAGSEGAELCESIGEDFWRIAFSTNLKDVVDITQWPEEFVGALSWRQNDVPAFFEQEFAGWPVIDLPTFKRPFIMIEGKAYCFDYFSFVDYFYRAIQKMVTSFKPLYQWSMYQQEASEKMVEDIFKKLLPNCLTYSANYYPINESLKQLAENDLIVIYDDTLIIVEVKAGSFVYTAPLTDFETHIKSYKTLIEKADWQCHRTKEYLDKQQNAILFNKNGEKKAEIDLTKIKSVYSIVVTVDNINAVAAKAEKLSFLKLKSQSISIAVDDLMVYAEYFDSPLIFLHFLHQRSLATQNPILAFNDELDHLGMYIFHNCYSVQDYRIPKDFKGVFVGYREELDHYFYNLYYQRMPLDKPVQKMPTLFISIIRYLENNAINNRSQIANYFLNFSLDEREKLCNGIEYSLKRQRQSRRLIPIHASGRGNSFKYNCIINIEGIIEVTHQWKREYLLANLHWGKDEERYLIDIYFDNQNNFTKIVLERYTPQDIGKDELIRISQKGYEQACLRLENYRKANKTKIGRNQLCPCGSGKKYKKCCGK